jgi:hypothetical protein
VVEASASHLSLVWEPPLSTGGYPATMLLCVSAPTGLGDMPLTALPYRAVCPPRSRWGYIRLSR